MTTNNSKGRGKSPLLEEILQTVQSIDENVEKVLDHLEAYTGAADHTEWYGPDANGDGREYG